MTERAALELDTLTIRIPIRLQRRGGRKLIMTPEGATGSTPKPRRDETLIKVLVRAHRWRQKIESGQAKSITDLAEQEGVTVAYVCRLLPLTCLAPGIVEAILDGRQPRGAEALGDAWEWTAFLERSAGEVGLQQLTRSAQGMRSTAIIRCRAFGTAAGCRDATGGQGCFAPRHALAFRQCAPVPAYTARRAAG